MQLFSSIKELFTRPFDKNQLIKKRIKILYNSSTYIIEKDKQSNKYICTVYYTTSNFETKEENFSIILDLHNKAILKSYKFNKIGSEENPEEFERKKEEKKNLNKFSDFILAVRMLLETLQIFIEKSIPFDYEYEAKFPEGNIIQKRPPPKDTKSIQIGEALIKLKETLSEYEKQITEKYKSIDTQL